QVKRAKRSDLDFTVGDHGQLTIRGARDKKGEVVEFTRGQRAAVDRSLRGYLRQFEQRFQESGADYLLFPGGRLVARGTGDPYVSITDRDSLSPISRTGLSNRWQ